MLDEYAVRNLYREGVLAAEVEPSVPERRSWIGVYAYKEPLFGPPDPAAEWRYRVRWLEVDRHRLAEREGSLEGDEDFIIWRGDVRVNSLTELAETLARWVLLEVQLTFPSHCGYPC
jgi:hypothetical protein